MTSRTPTADRAEHRQQNPMTVSRSVTAAMYAVVALTDLLIRDTSGDSGLPRVLGWVGILPCLPGLLAVILLWRRP